MRETQARQSGEHPKNLLMPGVGALLALGIELVILLIGSVAVSAGVLRADTSLQVTAAACLIGCLIGGRFACGQWRTMRLPCGLLTGVLCFGLILLIAALSGESPDIGRQGMIELASCAVGGCLAGVGGKKSKKKKNRRRASGRS